MLSSVRSRVLTRAFALLAALVLPVVAGVAVPATAQATDYIQQAWLATGGAAGPLGSPVSAETCTPDGACTQVFEKGTYYYTPSWAARYVLAGPLGAEWDAEGGLSGPLGYPRTSTTCKDADHCVQHFLNGTMAWSRASGAWPVLDFVGNPPVYWGSEWTYPSAYGYDFGFPTGAATCTLVHGGCRQDFERGSVYADVAHGNAYPVPDGQVRSFWASTGAEGGPLGYPAGLPGCQSATSDVCAQMFQGGEVVASAAYGAFVLPGTIGWRWTQDAGAAHSFVPPEGLPTAAAVCSATWCSQTTSAGVIGTDDPGSQHYPDVVTAPLYGRWKALGAWNGLGSPTGDQFCGLRNGGCGQHYVQYATGTVSSLYSSPATGVRVVSGSIRDAWASLGWETGFLGYPTGDAFCGLRNGGCGQVFQGGSIYSSAATGARFVRGAIRDAWGSLGWETGFLGYPTTDEFCGLRGGGCGQVFQGGSVYWSPATGARFVRGAIRDRWAAQGWETGALGYPTTSEFCGLRSGGCGQHFQGGSVYWSPTTGAHLVSGAIRQLWAGQGWETGRLGYPTGDPVPAGGGRFTQTFQGGRLTA